MLPENANYVPSLEAAAERMRGDIDVASDSFDVGLKTYQCNVFGLQWRSALRPGGMVRRLTRRKARS